MGGLLVRQVRGFDQETVPVPRNGLVHGAQAVLNFEASADPPQHLKESRLTVSVTKFGVNDLPAGKEDPAHLVPSLHPDGAGAHGEAFHLDEIGQCGSENDSLEASVHRQR